MCIWGCSKNWVATSLMHSVKRAFLHTLVAYPPFSPIFSHFGWHLSTMANASDDDISNSGSIQNPQPANSMTSNQSFIASLSESEHSTQNHKPGNTITMMTMIMTTTLHETSSMSASESYYILNCHSLKVLLILCQGMEDEEGNPIAVMSDLPWSAVSAKNIKLTAGDLREETVKRGRIFDDILVPPCPKAWR